MVLIYQVNYVFLFENQYSHLINVMIFLLLMMVDIAQCVDNAIFKWYEAYYNIILPLNILLVE